VSFPPLILWGGLTPHFVGYRTTPHFVGYYLYLATLPLPLTSHVTTMSSPRRATIAIRGDSDGQNKGGRNVGCEVSTPRKPNLLLSPALSFVGTSCTVDTTSTEPAGTSRCQIKNWHRKKFGDDVAGGETTRPRDHPVFEPRRLSVVNREPWGRGSTDRRTMGRERLSSLARSRRWPSPMRDEGWSPWYGGWFLRHRM
jgi:hypothetical protein